MTNKPLSCLRFLVYTLFIACTTWHNCLSVIYLFIYICHIRLTLRIIYIEWQHSINCKYNDCFVAKTARMSIVSTRFALAVCLSGPIFADNLSSVVHSSPASAGSLRADHPVVKPTINLYTLSKTVRRTRACVRPNVNSEHSTLLNKLNHLGACIMLLSVVADQRAGLYFIRQETSCGGGEGGTYSYSYCDHMHV